jgi:hypothetical protein
LIEAVAPLTKDGRKAIKVTKSEDTDPNDIVAQHARNHASLQRPKPVDITDIIPNPLPPRIVSQQEEEFVPIGLSLAKSLDTLVFGGKGIFQVHTNHYQLFTRLNFPSRTNGIKDSFSVMKRS